MWKPRTLAIVGSIAALSFAAPPIAQAASSHGKPAIQTSADSRDATEVRHLDQPSVDRTSVDRATVDKSRDIRDH
jgi:hypothetical protein